MADAETLPDDGPLQSLTFDEIEPGMSAELARVFREEDALLFAAVSGEMDPLHLNRSVADSVPFKDVIAPGMWAAALISSVIGTRLPGPGTAYLRQDLRFERPVAIGEMSLVRVTVAEKRADDHAVVLECVCTDGAGNITAQGRVEVRPPSEKLHIARGERPAAFIHERGDRLKALIGRASALAPVRAAVTHPVDTLSLAGALGAAEAGLIVPVLVGPQHRIEKAATELGADLSGIEIIDTPHSHASAARAVALINEGGAHMLIKGAIHTHEFLEPAVAREGGLRREERMSHVYVMDVPAYPKLLLVTDAALNIAPDLKCKADMAQNAINLARAMGIETPKLAILAAVEEVSARMKATLDAAALCKMADRGQIKGGLLDGPLAFDNAISPRAALAKGIVSQVAGDADILLAPDIDAANMLAKQLDYLAGAVAAGVVMGAKVPIVLPSRSEEAMSRIAACALARLVAASG
ncbi:MAG: bifunctional enoyl-CoA hydratase/phosphate acetyltransferase [Glycocaulis sp.]